MVNRKMVTYINQECVKDVSHTSGLPGDRHHRLTVATQDGTDSQVVSQVPSNNEQRLHEGLCHSNAKQHV